MLSEYHAVASMTGVFMIRVGRYKYVHYKGYRPQLYDLAQDPLETTDPAQGKAHGAELARCDAALRALLDPAAVTARAFADQARIAAFGGREQVLGNYPYTPAPCGDWQ